MSRLPPNHSVRDFPSASNFGCPLLATWAFTVAMKGQQGVKGARRSGAGAIGIDERLSFYCMPIATTPVSISMPGSRRNVDVNKKTNPSPQFDLDQLIQPDEYIRAVETEDELGCVLRMHLCLEQFLDKFIKEMMPPDHKRFHPKRQNFSGELSLSVAYGLITPLAEAIFLVNQIRNHFAHRRGTVLTIQDSEKIADLVDKVVVLPGKKEPPVRNLWIELCTVRPGEKLGFGKHGARIDFILACSALLRRGSGWMVIEYVRRHPELIPKPESK